MNYEPSPTDDKLMIDILASWFEYDAFNGDAFEDDSGGFLHIQQLIDNNQWHIIVELCKNPKLGNFKYVLTRKFMCYEFILWIKDETTEYIQSFFERYGDILIPIFTHYFQRSVIQEAFEGFILNDSYVYVETDTDDAVLWNEEHIQKLLSIEIIQDIFPVDYIRHIRSLIQNN